MNIREASRYVRGEMEENGKRLAVRSGSSATKHDDQFCEQSQAKIQALIDRED